MPMQRRAIQMRGPNHVGFDRRGGLTPYTITVEPSEIMLGTLVEVAVQDLRGKDMAGFSLEPSDARKLAAALNALADEIDG